MGYNEKSRLFLHPEEALFLLERGALVIQHHSVPMSLQQSYASLISQSCPFEKYQVYAYLKRLGYITLKHLENPAEQLPTEPAQTWLSTLMQYPTRMYEKILELLPGALASQKMTTLNQRYHTYDDIFKSLRTKSPEYLSRSSASDQWDRLDETESLSIDYDVYKPLPSFRKKAPGSPSFHIIVQKFEDTIPNPLAIERMKSLAEPKGEMLFAIASRGNISFVNMKTCETIVL
ncbi:tRNA-splicing endonuclease subunit sen54, variant 2 [Basidiobolus ranarum]